MSDPAKKTSHEFNLERLLAALDVECSVCGAVKGKWCEHTHGDGQGGASIIFGFHHRRAFDASLQGITFAATQRADRGG